MAVASLAAEGRAIVSGGAFWLADGRSSIGVGVFWFVEEGTLNLLWRRRLTWEGAVVVVASTVGDGKVVSGGAVG